jgi:nucleotide-binding universal stress UspA family protein
LYKRILLTLDGSIMSEQAIPVAAGLAKHFRAELYLLRVVNPLTKSYRTGLATLSAIQNTEEQLRVLADDYLKDIAEKIRDESRTVKIFSLIGVPYREIVLFSEQQEIDLIIMCTRGESGISRWLLGSITDHVIRGSKIPVMVVPATETN